MEAFRRSALLLGEDSIDTLSHKFVAVFGIGGVGSYAVEALARGGIGRLLLVDSDTIALSNSNRQLHATHDTIGRYKTQVMKERVLSINPMAQVDTREIFVLPDTLPELLEDRPDYIIDAVDTISAKLALAEECYQRGIPLISVMGAGNKLDPTQFRVGDLYETQNCPLCRVMRRELRRREVPALKVVYSLETPIVPRAELYTEEERNSTRRAIPGSVPFVPPVAGLIAAGEVLLDLSGFREKQG